MIHGPSGFPLDIDTRKLHCKGCPPALARAPCLHGSSVKLNDMLDDG